MNSAESPSQGQGPSQYGSRGPSLVILSSTLHAVSLPIIATRLWARSSPKFRLWWDDYTIIAAVAFDLMNWVLILLAVRYGLGRSTSSVSTEDRLDARKFLYFGQHAVGWAVAFAKLSIALMLFRLRPDSNAWRVFLVGMMLLSMAIAVTTSSVLFSACKPVSAMWDYTIPHAVCLSTAFISQAILAVSAITIATDVILSLLPLTFVMQIRKSVRERVLIVFVMSLGLVASAASICKVVSVKSKTLTGDTLLDGVDVTFWGMLEVQLGIIAACVPCLNHLVVRGVHRLGLMPRRTPTAYHMDGKWPTPTRQRQIPQMYLARGARDIDNNGLNAPDVELTPHGSTTSRHEPSPWGAINLKS